MQEFLSQISSKLFLSLLTDLYILLLAVYIENVGASTCKSVSVDFSVVLLDEYSVSENLFSIAIML